MGTGLWRPPIYRPYSLAGHYPLDGADMSDILKRVHVTTESVCNLELTPPHPPRTETAAYRRAHHFLVVEQDSPCLVCGITNSTLSDKAANVFAATAIETHHSPV